MYNFEYQTMLIVNTFQTYVLRFRWEESEIRLLQCSVGHWGRGREMTSRAKTHVASRDKDELGTWRDNDSDWRSILSHDSARTGNAVIHTRKRVPARAEELSRIVIRSLIWVTHVYTRRVSLPREIEDWMHGKIQVRLPRGLCTHDYAK